MTREYDPNEDELTGEHHQRLMSARPAGLDATRREAMFERIVSGPSEDGATAGAGRRGKLGVSTRRLSRSTTMVAAATVAAAAAAALPFSLGGHSGPASGSKDLRLASYSLLVPADYQVTSKVPAACDSRVVARPATQLAVFAVGRHGGGCVSMRLTPPYRPRGAGAPVITGLRNGNFVDAQATRVTIGKDPALLGSFGEGVAADRANSRLGGSVLDVMVPATGGQMRDLVITSVGMAPEALVGYVNNNLAMPQAAAVACSIPGTKAISWNRAPLTGGAATTTPAATTTSPAAAATSTSTTTIGSAATTTDAPVRSATEVTASTTEVAAATSTGPAATATAPVIVARGVPYLIWCLAPPLPMPCAQPFSANPAAAATTTPAATTAAAAATTTAAAATTTAPPAATTTAPPAATTTAPAAAVTSLPMTLFDELVANGELVPGGTCCPATPAAATATPAAATTTRAAAATTTTAAPTAAATSSTAAAATTTAAAATTTAAAATTTGPAAATTTAPQASVTSLPDTACCPTVPWTSDLTPRPALSVGSGTAAATTTSPAAATTTAPPLTGLWASGTRMVNGMCVAPVAAMSTPATPTAGAGP